jgi:RNA polymerase sigma factor (sigma-70 family)
LGILEQFEWSMLDGNRFQELCIELLASEGYEVHDQGIGPDGGVDAILLQTITLPDDTCRQIRWAAQFKFKIRPEATVTPKELGNVVNLLARFQADGFFLATNGRMTNKALLELRGTLSVRHPSYLISVWTRRHLEQRMSARKNVALRYFPGPPLSHSSVTVEITLDLPIQEFSEREQRLLRHALASFLDIPLAVVSIREISKGSTRVVIEIPKESAKLLQDAFEGDYLRLRLYGFEHEVLSVQEIESLEEGDQSILREITITDLVIPLSRHLSQMQATSYRAIERIAQRQIRGYMLNDYYGAQDLVQDALMALQRSQPHFDPNITEDQFYAIASKTIRRVLIDQNRAALSASRGGRLAHLKGDAAEILSDPLSDPIRNELLINVHEALDRLHTLDPLAADLIELLYFAGMDPNEIADKMGISITKVKREARVAILELRHLLDG